MHEINPLILDELNSCECPEAIKEAVRQLLRLELRNTHTTSWTYKKEYAQIALTAAQALYAEEEGGGSQ